MRRAVAPNKISASTLLRQCVAQPSTYGGRNMEAELLQTKIENQAVEIALLRGALAKIVRLEESESDDPMDDAVKIARAALI